jgi:hypothetical protein
LVQYSKNLVAGRQLRAARVLAGLTQLTLRAALGVDERQIPFWEGRRHCKPSRARYHARIEQALLEHGVIPFAEPSPGARLVKQIRVGERISLLERLTAQAARRKFDRYARARPESGTGWFLLVFMFSDLITITALR